jgi:hypothetical protein
MAQPNGAKSSAATMKAPKEKSSMAQPFPLAPNGANQWRKKIPSNIPNAR